MQWNGWPTRPMIEKGRLLTGTHAYPLIANPSETRAYPGTSLSPSVRPLETCTRYC